MNNQSFVIVFTINGDCRQIVYWMQSGLLVRKFSYWYRFSVNKVLALQNSMLFLFSQCHDDAKGSQQSGRSLSQTLKISSVVVVHGFLWRLVKRMLHFCLGDGSAVKGLPFSPQEPMQMAG